jgi:carboxymethylenebutenolidase
MALPTIERDTALGRYHSPVVADGEALPSLVLIHDVWGLSEHSRDLAAEIASEGFGVLEIDLYREMAEVSIDAPGPFIRSLSDRFAASAPFYGILSYEEGLLENPDGRDFDLKPSAPLEVASQLKTPLLASFGAEDDFVPLADVRDLESRLGESGTACRVDVYSGAGHAFLNRTREAAYRPEASAQAWAELIPFLHSHLD